MFQSAKLCNGVPDLFERVCIASHVQSGRFRLISSPISFLLLLATSHAVCAFGSQPPESGEPITLAHALALALELSPQLAAFSWYIRAAEASIIQVKLIPNTEISYDGADFTSARVRTATESM